MFKNVWKFLLSLTLFLCLAQSVTVHADTYTTEYTGFCYKIYANREYKNWEGASNISQFTDNKGNVCFSYYVGKTVTIVKTKDGKISGQNITLKMPYPIYGGVICDSKGYYYVVSGQKNTSGRSGIKTIFISKYNKKGKLIKTVGDSGGAGSFGTKNPFQAGNCSIAVNGNYLAVNYARGMYNGHQSNAAFVINTKKMKKVKIGSIYNSHSFAQRVVPYKKGFMFISEGDAYARAFTISTVENMSTGKVKTQNIFDFWIQQGKKSTYVINSNFAHMGDLVMLGKNKAALVATSAQSLNKNAATEKEQIFIQIFNPSKDLNKANAYVTSGKRSGLAGLSGTKKVTNYGVKWLTNHSEHCTIDHPQAVTDGKGNTIVLYEIYQKMGERNYYYGVNYFVVDKNGNMKGDIKKTAITACLNPCETPIYKDGTVYWIGNKAADTSYKVYIYSLKIDGQ